MIIRLGVAPHWGGHTMEAAGKRPRATRPPEELQLWLHLCEAPPQSPLGRIPPDPKKRVRCYLTGWGLSLLNRPNQTELKWIEIPETGTQHG